jgi:hypothetical protein
MLVDFHDFHDLHSHRGSRAAKHRLTHAEVVAMAGTSRTGTDVSDVMKRGRGDRDREPKTQQSLYPGNLLTLILHEPAPALFRVVVAVGVYTYLGDGELRLLTCGDVDLEHRKIHVTKAWVRARGKRPVSSARRRAAYRVR